MSAAPLRDRYVPVAGQATIVLHQPAEGDATLIHTGRLMGAMYARGELHHVRVSLPDGVVLMAPPAWIARNSRCRLLTAGLDVPPEWDDGSLFAPLLRELARTWGGAAARQPGETETVA